MGRSKWAVRLSFLFYPGYFLVITLMEVTVYGPVIFFMLKTLGHICTERENIWNTTVLCNKKKKNKTWIKDNFIHLNFFMWPLRIKCCKRGLFHLVSVLLKWQLYHKYDQVKLKESTTTLNLVLASDTIEKILVH